MERRTKIVGTLGPASQDEKTIRHLIKAGMNVARLNLSHGSHDDHMKVYQRLRKVAQEIDKPICILMDLQGPKVRIGKLLGDSITLSTGEKVTLTTRTDALNPGEIPVDFAQFPQSVQPGRRILLDDGNLELRVDSIKAERVNARVLVGGILKSHKGISLPEAHLDIRALTEKDLVDLEFGLQLGVDTIALSFVRTPEDVQYLREKIISLSPERQQIPVIAKLERPEALEHLEQIVEVSDGVMVARGDLGVEMSPETVPIAQKRIIECANRHAKVVITATQMLESMIHNPRPTRAEASDVANAIFDGTDAVMLSGETAVGEYPIQVVDMMAKIACQAESHVGEWGHWHGPQIADTGGDDTVFMSLAVRELAHDRNVAAIAVFTMSGRTALFVSKTRPDVPILAFTPDQQTYHRLELYWGVTPYLVPHSSTLEEMLADVDAVIRRSGVVSPGREVALTCGFPVATISPTNLVLLHHIGS
ncbi:MAG TPA: pyruvate kinase [Anaerolineales bacterium]|nr:pyruvate kinase [Anaerolineales bacterium]